MKRNFCKILSLLCVCVLLLLNSACSRTYQRCYYHAFSTDGVYSAEDTVYRVNGKYYVQGQRAQLRRERYRSWENFYEWYWNKGWSMNLIPGTEGEIVYRELAPEEDGTLFFKAGSEWQELNGQKLTLCPDKETTRSCTSYDVSTRRLTWRGLYALPAALACFAVEAPINVGSATLFLLGEIFS